MVTCCCWLIRVEHIDTQRDRGFGGETAPELTLYSPTNHKNTRSGHFSHYRKLCESWHFLMVYDHNRAQAPQNIQYGDSCRVMPVSAHVQTKSWHQPIALGPLMFDPGFGRGVECKPTPRGWRHQARTRPDGVAAADLSSGAPVTPDSRSM